MKTYLINMDKSRDRLEIMQKRLSTMGIDFERISAVDGSLLSPDELRIVHSPNRRYPNALTLGEVGCFFSHKKCWETFIASGEPWALVLEDDSVFHNDAPFYLQSYDWIPEGCELIQFSFTTDPTYSDKTITLENGNKLARVKYSSPCGTYAYMISRNAAKVAIECAEKVEGPIDNFLFGSFFEFTKKIDFWRLQNCVVRVIDDVAPTITGRGKKNKKFNLWKIHPMRLLEKVSHSFKRRALNRVPQYWK